MSERGLLTTGIVGTVITAMCCFTPLLAVLFGAAGISLWLGWVDWVLLPLLGLFAGITAYAVVSLLRRRTGLNE